jgi:sterol desaturase/sphingolipid hydroxylase (fatty acid hydroxylase superfamily)
MIGILGRMAGLAIALLVLAVVIGIFERFWPSIRGHKLIGRRGFVTDLAWFGFTPLVGRVIVTVGVFLAILPLLLTHGVSLNKASIQDFINRDTWMTAQPQWFQVVAILVVGDVLAYWLHRTFHFQPTLWRYHAVHHSSEDLDWLSAVRVHPFNEIGMRGVQAFVLLALGFSGGAVAAFVPLLTLYAIFLHANVSWSYGPFKYVIASPAFHRWHHTSEEEGLNINFAGAFPGIDMLFRTFYMPPKQQPAVFGVVGNDVPENFFKQLVYPFRRSGRRPKAVAAVAGSDTGA